MATGRRCLTLRDNGVELTASNQEALTMVLALAAGDIDEAALTAWIDAHSSVL